MIDTGPSATIALSILSTDFATPGREVRDIASAGADGIRAGVIDGMSFPTSRSGRAFVDNIFGRLLMIEACAPYLALSAKVGCDVATVPAEAAKHVGRSPQAIRALAKIAALPLNPATPVEAIECARDRLALLVVTAGANLLAAGTPAFKGGTSAPVANAMAIPSAARGT